MRIPSSLKIYRYQPKLLRISAQLNNFAFCAHCGAGGDTRPARGAGGAGGPAAGRPPGLSKKYLAHIFAYCPRPYDTSTNKNHTRCALVFKKHSRARYRRFNTRLSHIGLDRLRYRAQRQSDFDCVCGRRGREDGRSASDGDEVRFDRAERLRVWYTPCNVKASRGESVGVWHVRRARPRATACRCAGQ